MSYQILQVTPSSKGVTFREIACTVVALGVGFASHYFMPIPINEDVERFKKVAEEEKSKLININKKYSLAKARIEEKLRSLNVKQRGLLKSEKDEKIAVQSQIISELKNRSYQQDRELADLRDYIQVQTNMQTGHLNTLNKYNIELQKSSANNKLFRDATIGLAVTSAVLLATLGGVIYLRL